jgi:sn-glycerol 3-phosphate transport system ATP-binding protein
MSRIDIHELTKEWGKTVAVDRVSFTVENGRLTVLLGPSGCGKSTILRLIAGLETATSGDISIGGETMTHADPAKRGVSMVFQSYALFPHLNVRENILFGLKVRGVSQNKRQARLHEAAHMVGLEALLERKPAQLSGGQRQRVALARTIVSRRKVCLMDEPLSNLDAKLRAEMRDEIRSLQRKLGLTMIYVTHDQVEAMTMADQVVLLKDGRIEQTGTPHDLYERPETTFVARFMGSPPMNLLEIDSEETRSALADACEKSVSIVSLPEGAIGIRPEHVRLNSKGLPVKVLAVEYLGAESVLRLSYGDQVLFAKTEGHRHYGAGEMLYVSWPLEALHCFGADGLRIGTG